MRQLLHLSDVHFGPLFVPEVAAGALALAERRRPDVVVISGDLTQRATTQQFRDARAFVDDIEALGLPTLTVPGNHDVPMYRHFFFQRVFSPYGAYRRHFSPDLEPTFQDDELFLLGLNTAYNWTVKDGRLTRAKLHRVAEQLAAVPPELARIVVAHHHLIPPPRYDTQRVMKNAYETVETLSRGGVELVLSGHLHQAYVGSSEAYYPTGRRPVLLLHSGTSTSSRGRGSERRRNTANWVVIDDREIAISHLGWIPSEGQWAELSCHRYPRRTREPYTLEML